MSYLDIANRTLAELRATHPSAKRSAISAAVMRILSSGGSVRVGGNRLVIIPPQLDAAETNAAIETLRNSKAETISLLEALDVVKAAGVKLPLDRGGQRVAAIPRNQETPGLRRALVTLGYSLPVVITE